LKKKNDKKIISLKLLAGILVFGGLIIGVMAQVLAPRMSSAAGETINHIYLLFESIGRGLLVIGGGAVVIAIFKEKKRTGKLRRNAVIGFMISSFVLLVFLPLSTGFLEYYIVLMPFPWSTLPLQILYDGFYFSTDYNQALGGNGVKILLIAYTVFNVVVYGGIAFYGRRFFCSMICCNFGAHAETLKEGLPMFGSRKNIVDKIMPKIKKPLGVLKWLLLSVNLILILLWVAVVLFHAKNINVEILRTVEVFKYLIFELLIVLYAFMLISGRTYCYYCTAGTMISLGSRLAGQKIVTDKTKCINCGKCNKVCDMGIDIMSNAAKKSPVKSLSCVGGGACVDTCPVKTLEYSTHFLSNIK
jgi:ferredoxin-type protein NapH